MNKIFIMGGTGTVGTALLKELSDSSYSIRAGTRRPIQNQTKTNSNIEWIKFDLENPETYSAALKDCNQVFLISRPGDENAEITAKKLLTSIQEHKIDHITYLSAMGTEKRSDFSIRKVERLIEKTGISYTFLRPNFFMQIFATGILLNSIKSNNILTIPAGDSKLSFIDSRDVAAVAAKIIINHEKHTNNAYTLTGTQTLTHSDVAGYISKAINKTVQYLPLNPDSIYKCLEAVNIPVQVISRLDKMYRLVRNGECKLISNHAETILNRQLISFEKFSQDYKDCWTS